MYKRAAEDMPRLMLVAIFGKEEVARNLQYVCGTRATLFHVDADHSPLGTMVGVSWSMLSQLSL